MTAAAETYQYLLFDLMVRRQVVGGALDPGVESDLVGALDACWREMSDEEQESAEREFAGWSAPVGAPERLGLFDAAVEKGEHLAPRRAA